MSFHPEYHSYATQSARLNSFKTWPQDLIQSPEEMASAGFFYTGINDGVICYFCGGKLKDWSREDLPWSEHARWFQFCPYVLLMKGKEYVQRVINESCEITENHERCAHNNKICLKADVNESVEYVKKSRLFCKICFDNEVTVCYRPCGHAITCAKCALSLNNMLCPICRTEIVNVIRIYLS
ncbi:baculoviral IAP repeat-containing protein 7-like [Bicyclus anynana]|uniref:Baculoviral IAP repeat-containing protein 7-like n=1 Tax=Bicyclus anynana TaxID=110368 RepID=A0ABM3M637_BICAN|nr:baculoviral IAP repeat-containing protein 7-like [Bicyclus anynana]